MDLRAVALQPERRAKSLRGLKRTLRNEVAEVVESEQVRLVYPLFGSIIASGYHRCYVLYAVVVRKERLTVGCDGLTLIDLLLCYRLHRTQRP